MDKDILIKLIDVWLKFNKKDSAITDFFDCNDYFLGKEIQEFKDVILDYLGVPKDNSTEMLELHGSKCYENIEFFCRDWFIDQFYECADGKISAEELVNELCDAVDELK